MKLVSLVLAVLVYSASASASFGPSFGPINDLDLSGPHKGILGQVPLELHADDVKMKPGQNGINVTVARADHQRWTPVQALVIRATGPAGNAQAMTDENGMAHFQAPPNCAGTNPIHATITLENPQFQVTQDGRKPYTITADLPCQGDVALLFKSDSNGGQALGIWQIGHRARVRIAQALGTAWKNQIDFIWPSDGDYYTGGSVNVTRGDQWDVVGHELGHGIYDMGRLGSSQGGQHKIDECYSATLALSEGWASFFSAWISVDPRDPDAKFEYMVPRRAPIRFEHIPDDVCKGEKNEWRVTGFFWDLYDLNADGENANETFAKMWGAMAGSRAPSTSAAASLMERAGISADLLRLVWELNFKSPVAF